MAQTVGDFFWQRLHEWGVRRVFGYPGDGINGLLGALERLDGKIEFVQVRHEEMAAFMASAHAKFTGELGVCLATSGPGASHLITGLYDARLDHMPVLAIAGQQARDRAWAAHYQQEIDLDQHVQGRRRRLRAAGRWSPAQVRHLIDRAVRIAMARTPGHGADLAQRSAGHAVRGPAAQARRRAFRRRLHARRRSCPTKRTCGAPPTC